MTNAEIRALLERVNPRQLREDAGIRPQTVMRALGMTRQQLWVREQGVYPPTYEPGYRWVRFLAGLERHAEVSAEIAATERREAA